MKLVAGAVACFAGAALLALLAADVSGGRSALEAGDVRYRVAPADEGLWRADERLPFGAARRLLGVGDDLAVREALRSLRLSDLDDSVVSDPDLALRRGEARVRLQRLAGGSGDVRIRSRATGLLGVLSFLSSLTEVQDQEGHLREAIRNFQDAVALDPENAEAKLNLELALQRGRAVQVAEASGGPNPTPGGAGSRGAGAGQAGSGY